MVVVTVDGDRARFEVQGWDKLWALTSRLGIRSSWITSTTLGS
jgi:hypothetical protein